MFTVFLFAFIPIFSPAGTSRDTRTMCIRERVFTHTRSLRATPGLRDEATAHQWALSRQCPTSVEGDWARLGRNKPLDGQRRPRLPPRVSLNTALFPGFDHLRAAAAPLPLARAQLCRISGEEASSDGLSPGAHRPQGIWGLWSQTQRRGRGRGGGARGQRSQEPGGPPTSPLGRGEPGSRRGRPQAGSAPGLWLRGLLLVGLSSLGVALNADTAPLEVESRGPLGFT